MSIQFVRAMTAIGERARALRAIVCAAANAPARLVRVEEVLVVILVRLPLGERVADGERDAAKDEEERVIVDAERL